jgi:hypothetical protein
MLALVVGFVHTVAANPATNKFSSFWHQTAGAAATAAGANHNLFHIHRTQCSKHSILSASLIWRETKCNIPKKSKETLSQWIICHSLEYFQMYIHIKYSKCNHFKMQEK